MASKDISVTEILSQLRRLLLSPKDSTLRADVVREIIASVDKIAEAAASVTGMLAQSASAQGVFMPVASFWGAANSVPSSPRAAIEEALQALRAELNSGKNDAAQISAMVASCRKLSKRLERL